MTTKNGSAEIYEFDDARSRLRGDEVALADFETIGDYLKTMRESLGLTPETISERTHIKVEYLDAIEAMNLDSLPSKPFALGFVKGYAEALELDAQPIVDRFKEEAGYVNAALGNAAGKKRETTPAPTAPTVETERPQMSLWAVVAVLFFILWCSYQITRPRDTTTPLNLNGFPAAQSLVGGGAIMDPVEAAQPQPVEVGATPGGDVNEQIIVEARIIDRIEPVYPPRCAATAATQETLIARFTITTAGGVANERIAQSSNACFDRAVLNAVRRWRFVPRTVDGVRKPVFEQQFAFQFDRPA